MGRKKISTVDGGGDDDDNGQGQDAGANAMQLATLDASLLGALPGAGAAPKVVPPLIGKQPPMLRTALPLLKKGDTAAAVLARQAAAGGQVPAAFTATASAAGSTANLGAQPPGMRVALPVPVSGASKVMGAAATKAAGAAPNSALTAAQAAAAATCTPMGSMAASVQAALAGGPTAIAEALARNQAMLQQLQQQNGAAMQQVSAAKAAAPAAVYIPPEERAAKEAAGELRPGDWICPHCNTRNFADKERCFNCGKNRPDDESKRLGTNFLNDPDILELFDHFQIDSRHMMRFCRAMERRYEAGTFAGDMIKMWQLCEKARNPEAMLVSSFHELEQGTFIGLVEPCKRLLEFKDKYNLDKVAMQSLTDVLAKHKDEKRDAFIEELDPLLATSGKPSAMVMMVIKKIANGISLGKPGRVAPGSYAWKQQQEEKERGSGRGRSRGRKDSRDRSRNRGGGGGGGGGGRFRSNSRDRGGRDGGRYRSRSRGRDYNDKRDRRDSGRGGGGGSRYEGSHEQKEKDFGADVRDLWG